MIYDVWNHLGSWRSYSSQMKRWFVFPRQSLLPFLAPWDRMVLLLGGTGNLVPTLLALLGPVARSRRALQALGASLALSSAVYLLTETWYLGRRTPARRWPLLLVVVFITPLQILHALVSNSDIEWRGQRLRIRRGGSFEVMR
jgi:hypothetical protein